MALAEAKRCATCAAAVATSTGYSCRLSPPVLLANDGRFEFVWPSCPSGGGCYQYKAL